MHHCQYHPLIILSKITHIVSYLVVTNHPVHDPDIQHVPFIAISPVFLSSLYSTYYHRVMAYDAFAKIVLPLQHKLYYVVMSLARFNLYANSYGFLLLRSRRDWSFFLEIFSICAFWVWYGKVLMGTGSWITAIASVLVSNMVASPLHVQASFTNWCPSSHADLTTIQIVLSHFARSTDDLGPVESFVHRQLRTTTDVICPDSLAFLHGGLHLQVTHHLFPRLPRHNLRAASLLVKEFAQAEGIEYAEFGFIEGNGEVLDVLKGVADQARIMGMVAGEEIKHKINGHHH